MQDFESATLVTLAMCCATILIEAIDAFPSSQPQGSRQSAADVSRPLSSGVQRQRAARENLGRRRASEQIQEETSAIAAAFDRPPDFEHVTLLPRRGQVVVQLIALGWDPE